MIDIVSYFRRVAEEHIMLRHTPEKPSFFREFESRKVIFGDSDFLEKVRKAQDYILVCDFNGDGAIREVNYDQMNRVYSGAIMLLKRLKTHDYDGIEASRKELLDIWEDIHARMRKDIETGELCIEGLDISIMSLGKIHDGWYGIAIFLSFSEIYEPRYRPERWQNN